MSTTITTQPAPRDLKSMIASPAMLQQFAAALPKHLSPERFGRIAITALSRTPKLKECTQESVFKCLLDLSAMGLEPDGRHAHLIPYGQECTLIIDYKGLVSLVRRSGDVAKIHADIVCENDVFEHSMGEVQKHTFDLNQGRGQAYAAYAQVWLKDGSVQASIMSKDEIEAIREKSSAWGAWLKYKKRGPWNDNEGEMWKKTAFRRLTKWLTISPEIADAITKADEHEFNNPRNVTPKAELPKENPFRLAAEKEEAPQPAPRPTPEAEVVTKDDDQEQADIEARNEARFSIFEAIKETAVTPDTFFARAKKAGWTESNESELTTEDMVQLTENAQAIADGVQKGGAK